MSRARDLGSSINSNYSGKNLLVNGAMDFWQRGTSIPLSTNTYTADRWFWYRFGGGATVSRQLVNDSVNLPNIQYSLRVQRDAGNSGTNVIGGSQSLETINSIPFAGKTVTLSFYARAGSNFSQASNTLTFAIVSGTGTDQVVTLNYTGVNIFASVNAVLTTAWQRFSCTGTIPTNANEIAVGIGNFLPVGTAGANDWFEYTGVQLEVGSSATPFSRAGGDIQGELAKCQRYYYQTDSYAIASYSAYNSGNFVSSAFAFPVTMRIAPAISVTDIPGNANRMTQYPLGGSAVANITPPSAVNIRTTHWFYEAGGTSNGSQGTGGAFAVRYIASAEL
jgi:hypothetical protein